MARESYKPDYIRFTHTWGNKSGKGRRYKSRASRARRRFGRRFCWAGEDAYRHSGQAAGAESECSWRGW